jgi:FdrA protein
MPTLIHALGVGISQVIGTGGRDLSSKVCGRTMLPALEALKEDTSTEVVVIISKPPADEVAQKILKDLGFIVIESNVKAVELAANLVRI